MSVARDIEQTFRPWWDNPRELARLYRWLCLFERQPEDVAAFMENAVTWERDWLLMEAVASDEWGELEGRYEMLKVVVRGLESKASIGQSILRAQSRVGA